MTCTDNEVLIKVDNVSKKFCRDFKKSLWYGLKDTASDVFNFNNNKPKKELPHLREGEFWANQNISFEVKRGESLGLIGYNGAGKTTLLKMLNGLIKPDTGSIEMHGKVGALIALGAGFNPILTGRENIYVNGSILGLHKKEIEGKLDEIIEFAELEAAIDAPVRTYSSGMQVRLGFAIAAVIIKPKILLLDEVLAVGDFKFRAKCLSRVNELKQSGTSLILVSHLAQQIVQNTNKCIFLQNGKIEAIGPTLEVYRLYENQNDESNTNEDEKRFGGTVKSSSSISDISLTINTNVKEDVISVSAYENITFVTKFKCSKNFNLGITIVIHDMDGTRIAVFNNLLDNTSINIDSEGLVSFCLWIESLQLISGDYTVVLVIQDGSEYHFRNSVKRFSINTKDQVNDLYKVGLIKPKYEWE